MVLSLTVPGSWGQGALEETGVEKQDYVILLHGMGRTRHSMKRMEKGLARHGYKVINMGYPSTSDSIEILVKKLDEIIKAECKDRSRKINFVTHSLGGILVRYYLKKRRDINVGRVVMLSPPNSGSEIVDRLKDVRLYELVTGPAGQRLGTGTNDLPRTLGPVDFDLGVIAGDRSFNPFYSGLINGSDDGKVSVESAKVAGMKDFLVVHYSHTFIMQKKAIIQQVLHFLQHGRFED